MPTRSGLARGWSGNARSRKERILLTEVPSDYIRINSGLGDSPPLNVVVLPILFEGSVRAVIELASFAAFSPTHQSFLEQLTESIGLVLNTVEATSVTEQLLERAQSQAQELQSRQEQLRQSNEELAEQAALLADKNSEVEGKYQEVEEAKRLVEEKATELSVSSKYKSEFIANMSHELRTPLNSLLVLAEQLEDNPEGNLTERQVRYASTIRSSGADLLKLLNDILDLAKVESKTTSLEIANVTLASLGESMMQSFGPVAEDRGLAFSVTVEDGLPEALRTDPHRLRQVLKNLLTNAFKFTENGSVALLIEPSSENRFAGAEPLASEGQLVAISVTDTGIGIAKDMQAAIFEAFAQADGGTARLYGGTGLGLSISRNLVRLLGGEITLASSPGEGSTFTVYLPLEDVPGEDRLSHREILAESASGPPTPKGPRTRAPAEAIPLVPTTNGTIVAKPPASNGVVLEAARCADEGEDFYSGSAADATVLVVDDDFRNIFALTALLERGSINVVASQGGVEALELLDERSDIDLVLMDIMMPGMDGYEAMREVRKRPDLVDLPIIAVTGKVVDGERDRCLAAGASDYIPKPVDTSELLTALREWFPPGAWRP